MRIVAALLSLVLLLGCATRGISATNDIVNFGRVNDSLYRGAQPDQKGMRQLQTLGVRSVINLRMTNDVWSGEQAAAQAYAMAYTNIPLPALEPPTDAQVVTVLAAISTMPKPVFIHCQYGRDRTGTIIACYRIQTDHWTNSSALEEAEAYGISPFEVGMRKYIRHFRNKRRVGAGVPASVTIDTNPRPSLKHCTESPCDPRPGCLSPQERASPIAWFTPETGARP